MKTLTILLFFLSQFTYANDCRKYYEVDSKNSRFQLFESVASIKSKFEAFMKENTAHDFAQACQAGMQTCLSTLSKGAKTSAELAVLQAKAVPLAVGKALLSPIDTISFSIEPSKVKKQVVEPFSDILKKGKDAAANLERIENGLLDPQKVYKLQNQERPFSALKGFFFKKSDTKIIDELRKEVEDLEVEIWSHGYYSFGMIGVFGITKMPATVSVDMVTGMITAQEGSVSKTARDIAQKIIFDRMKNSFKQNKHLPMIDRTRTALLDAFSFTNAKEDVLEAKHLIFEEFGFNDLLIQINRDPHAEGQNSMGLKVPESKDTTIRAS